MHWLAQMLLNLYLACSVFMVILKHVQSSLGAETSQILECQQKIFVVLINIFYNT